VVSNLSSSAPPFPSDGVSDIAALVGSKAGEVDLEALAQFAKVLRTKPVFNYQTVYGVVMIPSKQIIVPIN
jgi:hypothetical protein